MKRSLILRAWTMRSMRMISSSMTGEADQKSKYFENIAGYKHLSVVRYIEEERYLMGFIFFTGVNFILTMVAAVLCVCFTPTAVGPGIPEIKAYLDGVDTPNMFGATTLIVKMLVLDLFISIMTKLILVKVHNWKALLQCNKICRSREKRIKQTTKKGKEYFGQYGKVLKVSISRTAAGAIQHFANNTCSVYITYSKEEEAVRCIQSVHGFTLDGRSLRWEMVLGFHFAGHALESQSIVMPG
ncbi:hypothetical protein CsSME_00021574 [Camellia sinensis var. sinensis]